MPTRNVNLTPELDHFISSTVETGLYANASEVVRAALRLLERNERIREKKVAALSAAIEAGMAGGVAEPGTFSRIRDHIGQPRLLSESLKILNDRGSTVTLDSEFGHDLEEIINAHREPLNPPSWD